MRLRTSGRVGIRSARSLWIAGCKISSGNPCDSDPNTSTSPSANRASVYGRLPCFVLAVQVTLAVQRTLPFSSLFIDQPPQITARATAASTPGTDDYCVVSLENTTKTGIDASGSSEVIMDCGMITNSVASNAAAAGGSGSVTATVIAAAGGIQQSNNWDVDKYDPYVPAEDDPYADLEPSAAEKAVCTSSSLGNLNVNNSNTGGTIDGDNFANNTVCLSSISVGSNRTYTLRDGVFLIDGGGINVQGTLNVINATLVLTNDDPASDATIGTFDMNAQAVLNIDPPSGGAAWSDKWAGMAIYQDRRAVDNSPTGQIASNSPNKINGGSAGNVKGVLYAVLARRSRGERRGEDLARRRTGTRTGCADCAARRDSARRRQDVRPAAPRGRVLRSAGRRRIDERARSSDHVRNRRGCGPAAQH